MKRFMYLATAMLTLSGPAAQAGLGMNGPALDGRQVALPDSLRIGDTPAAELQKITTNGPALDGRHVVLSDGLRIGGAPAAEEVNGLHLNGPALDGRRNVTPDLAGLVIDHQRLPSDTGGILPIDQRWPGSGQSRQVQQ